MIPAFRKLRQEDHDFKDHLKYFVSTSKQTTNKIYMTMICQRRICLCRLSKRIFKKANIAEGKVLLSQAFL